MPCDNAGEKDLGMATKFLVIGIDAALAETGWGAVVGSTTDDAEVLGYGVIKTEADWTLSDRLTTIRKRVRDIVRVQRWLLSNGKQLPKGQTSVAIERTDYEPGSAGTRTQWIREARAREALAFGVSAAVIACDDVGIVPQLIGPNEWQRQLGATGTGGAMKDSVAQLVAYQFPQLFVCEWVKSRKRALPYERAVLEAESRKRVPTHVTDALGMAYVVLNQRCAEARGVAHVV